MAQRCTIYANMGNVGAPGFDWDLYENGWNGSSLQTNGRIKSKKSEKIFCHESYAQELYDKMSGIHVQNVKDVRKGDTVSINDIKVVDENTIIASVGGGASNVLIDLNKESKFISNIRYKGQPLGSRSEFVDAVRNDVEFKNELLAMDLTAKIGTDKEKGSIWDGYVENLTREFREQITKNSKAYWAKVISTNNGGFVVEVAGTVQAFMPGSMAASNKISDYNSLVGKILEVMIESYNPKYGFVVSRKKYLNKVRPFKLQPIKDTLENAPETVYTGVVTGSTQFGIFVELDEFITGMLHKTLVSDEMREKMRNQSIEPGTEVSVYVHKIENNRVILSDVAPADRPAVMAKREEEDNAEKSEHIANKNAGVVKNND